MCVSFLLSLPCTSSLRKLYSAITMPSVTFAVLQPCTAMLRHRHDTALTNSHNREPRIEEASRTWRVFDFMFQHLTVQRNKHKSGMPWQPSGSRKILRQRRGRYILNDSTLFYCVQGPQASRSMRRKGLNDSW